MGMFCYGKGSAYIKGWELKPDLRKNIPILYYPAPEPNKAEFLRQVLKNRQCLYKQL